MSTSNLCTISKMNMIAIIALKTGNVIHGVEIFRAVNRIVGYHATAKKARNKNDKRYLKNKNSKKFNRLIYHYRKHAIHGRNSKAFDQWLDLDYPDNESLKRLYL